MNVAFTSAAEGLPRRAFTVEDIRRMIDAGVIGEDERIELLEGEIVVMSAKGYAHDLIKNKLNMAIVRAVPDATMVGVEMTIQFTDNTILEPDLAIFEQRSLVKSDANFAHLTPGDLILAIEVAASSMVYDKGLKAKLYARHRVRELWVIDANERVTWVHTEPRDDGWGSIVERGPNETLTTPAIPGLAIRLADID